MNKLQNKSPLVSVIIPTYNRANYLQEALESVFRQNYHNFEIIVVDDGSTDDTRKIIDKYQDKIKYFWQDNSGPSVARNLGIKNSQGELIAFLDSDDLMLPDRLSLQVSKFLKNPRLGLVGGSYLLIDSKSNPIGECKLSWIDRHRLKNGIHYRNFFSTTVVMIRKACVEKVGGFSSDFSFGEDWDLWLRIIQDYQFEYIITPIGIVRRHEDSIVGSMDPYNFVQWDELIDREYNRSIINSNYNKIQANSIRKKQISFMLANRGWVRSKKMDRGAREDVVMSIFFWPWWGLWRYRSVSRYFFDKKLLNHINIWRAFFKKIAKFY